MGYGLPDDAFWMGVALEEGYVDEPYSRYSLPDVLEPDRPASQLPVDL